MSNRLPASGGQPQPDERPDKEIMGLLELFKNAVFREDVAELEQIEAELERLEKGLAADKPTRESFWLLMNMLYRITANHEDLLRKDVEKRQREDPEGLAEIQEGVRGFLDRMSGLFAKWVKEQEREDKP
jgi:hypothetical protein